MIPYVKDGRYPLRENNEVTFWIDGLAFYQRLSEVIRGAQREVIAGISFIQPGFTFPGGATFWDVMQSAAARGVSVKLLFWRNPHFSLSGHIFQGTPSDLQMLRQAAPDVEVRWDDSPAAPHCHHQKFWVIDDAAFVGGMVLSKSTIEDRAHSLHKSGKHDSFVEIRGESVVDVYDNFTQRWSGLLLNSELRSQDRIALHGFAVGSKRPLSDLKTPNDPMNREHGREHPPKKIREESARCGSTSVQLSRTLAPGLYQPEGEADIWEQYKLAFAHAKKTIYIENQHPGEEQLLVLLREALRRGVRVVYVLPGEPMRAIIEARESSDARYASTFAIFASLEEEPNFTLAALATKDKEIYVHSKLCIVDGEWVTIGSANLVDLSMCQDHTELNASIWSSDEAMRLLRDLYQEHTHLSAKDDDDVALLASMQEIARENALKRGDMKGHLYALRPSEYGR